MLNLHSFTFFFSIASLATAGPCDLYAAGKTPCVAAHSTTRALFNSYSGPLYQVTRSSDNSTAEIMPVSTGGMANSSSQDTFCSSTSCVISVIYDQTGNANDLTPAPPGGAAKGPGPNGYDLPANATAAPVTLNGHKVYGVYISPGMGYRNDDTVGVATGNNPEGMYAVLDGTHYNNKCCFDYGNAEKNNTDNGKSHMETIYFGNDSRTGSGAGTGPWIMADMENGLFSGQNPGTNQNDPIINDRFVTAMVKGQQKNHWELRGGDATTGKLSTFYSGKRASGYYPMNKEGAIILGIGGDNSNGAQGTFYEGAMTAGYPTDAVENRVQGNIVAATYAT